MLKPDRSLPTSFFTLIATLGACSATVSCASSGGEAAATSSHVATGTSARVLQVSDVDWGALNPARGDASPRAATLWGDRTESGPSGFLVRFADGFSSPPHIHNVTYRGVVIHGLIHNDDPDAASMWLPTGSYWTQAVGESHITAASGNDNLAYIEIDDGPYLVQPTTDAFESADRSVNIDASNLVWIDASEFVWGQASASHESKSEPQVAHLWGDTRGDALRGVLIRIPAGTTVELRGDDMTCHAVVIQGHPTIQTARSTPPRSLEPGSYVGSSKHAAPRIAAPRNEATTIYARSNGTVHMHTIATRSAQ